MDSYAHRIEARTRWAVRGLLALGLMISFVDRTSLSSALADKGFVSEFALSSVERGWLNSAFFWSYGLLQMPMGWLVDRYGVKWPYTLCFTLWCAGRGGHRHGDGTLSALILMRLLIGVAESVAVPATYRYLANNFDETEKGTALGIFSIGGKMGPALGAPAAAWMIVNFAGS
jgi:ACS family D-galactonate transporter-like MFS transporter